MSRSCGFWIRSETSDQRLLCKDNQRSLGARFRSLGRQSRSMKRARHRAVSGVVVTSINFNRYNTPHRSTPTQIVQPAPCYRVASWPAARIWPVKSNRIESNRIRDRSEARCFADSESLFAICNLLSDLYAPPSMILRRR